MVSAKSSILTNTRLPRRRSASISLLRAIANSQGANARWRPGMPLQMHREQNVLHDVLGLIDRLPCRARPRRGGPQDRAIAFKRR